MSGLPDYIVLDFLEWISQDDAVRKEVIESLLDRELAQTYAKRYLHEEFGQDYKKCRRRLKRNIIRMINSIEFDDFMERRCENRNCGNNQRYCSYSCLHEFYHEYEYLLINRFKEQKILSENELGEIKPETLIDSLYDYFGHDEGAENE